MSKTLMDTMLTDTTLTDTKTVAAEKQKDAKTRVVIVGGGLAGMAAAEALVNRDRADEDRSDRNSGLDITILEAKRMLGGRAGSFTDAASQDSVDYCQHVAMGCCTNWIGLLQRCGLADQLHRYEKLTFLHPDHPSSRFAPSSWLPPPLHLASTIGAIRYLSSKQKSQIRTGLWRLMRTRTQDLGDQFAADWLTRNGQDAETIAQFWDIILVSALGEETDRVSMAAARKVFIDGFAAARGASDVLVPKLPLSELFGQRLAQRLQQAGVAIRTQTAVVGVAWSDSALEVRLGDDQTIRADHVILAVPWYRVASLMDADVGPSTIDHLKQLGDMPTSPITGLHLWFDRQITALPHAVMVGTLAQWLFRQPFDSDSNSDSDSNYYQVVISASHQTRRLSSDEIVSRVIAELRHAFPDACQAKLLRHRIVTDPRSVFSISPEVESIRPPARTALPRLHLAGDWIATGWPATMEGAVIGGRMAAAEVARHCGLPIPTIDAGLRRGWLARRLIRN